MTAASFPLSHRLQHRHTAFTIACHSLDEFAAPQPAEKSQYDLAITVVFSPSLFSNPHLRETATLLLSPI
jgi:hypothetical protein